MNLRPFRGQYPRLGARVYVDPAATVIGDVEIGDDSSIWPGTVVRGDVNVVRIGARSNLQDGTILHVSHAGPHSRMDGYATVIGDDVTIGHGAIIHACRIGNAALVGMGAIVMDGAVVEDHGYVGAGALVSPGKTVRSRELWLGNPARLVRMIDDAAVEGLLYSAAHYVRLKDDYLAAG
jgi:carbonic anhydrase/acetyltransferase-like protein (isoleucine patch superfamily)